MDHSEPRQQQLTNQSQQQQHPGVGVVASSGQMAYGTSCYQTTPMVATATTVGTVSSPTQPPNNFAPQQQLAYHQAQHFYSQQQQPQLQAFWVNQMQEIYQNTNFKSHGLPLAPIKKIMKADEDVRMISAEAPVIFAKACQIFILELTLRSWIHTEENKRRTLQKNDIAAAISRTDVFDFLVDIIPRDEFKEEGLGITKAAVPLVGSADGLPYCYMPPQPLVGGTAMAMGRPIDQAALYNGHQHQSPLPFMSWPQSHIRHPAQQPPPQQQPNDS